MLSLHWKKTVPGLVARTKKADNRQPSGFFMSVTWRHLWAAMREAARPAGTFFPVDQPAWFRPPSWSGVSGKTTRKEGGISCLKSSILPPAGSRNTIIRNAGLIWLATSCILTALTLVAVSAPSVMRIFLYLPTAGALSIMGGMIGRIQYLRGIRSAVYKR